MDFNLMISIENENIIKYYNILIKMNQVDVIEKTSINENALI
jgi:hypothetical protein